VSQKATSIHAAVMGLGFAWFPEETVRGELEPASLSRCRCAKAASAGRLYLVFADRDYAGPGARRLAEIIREDVAGSCPQVCLRTVDAGVVDSA